MDVNRAEKAKKEVIIMNDKESLEYVIADFVSCAKERKEKSDKNIQNGADDFEKGRRLAYFEMLDMLETRCKVYGVDLEAILDA
jgi:hypothetical protein